MTDRSYLFVPGNRPERFDKACRAGADIVLIDLEDAVAVVDKVALRRGTSEVARAYLEYLYSKEGQEIVAKHYYRPRDPEVAAKYAKLFPKVELVTIADFGGWNAVHKKHFADGGVFDEIYAR